MKTFNTLFEEVSQKQLNDLETFADRLLNKFDVDIEFTRHFADRMNDARNKPAITITELEKLFKKMADNQGKKIKKYGNKEAILKDMQSDLNLPIVINWKNGEFEVVHKTIMRKKNFKSPDPEVKYESVAKEAKKMKDDPCWKDHEMVGTKTKNGKQVPNCVPKEDKGTDMPSESTAEYSKSQAAIARKKQQAAMKPGEMDKLKRLRDMLKNANKKESAGLGEAYKGKNPDNIKSVGTSGGSILAVTNAGNKYTLSAKDTGGKMPKAGEPISKYVKESVEIDEATKEGTIRIIDLGNRKQDSIRKELGVDGLPNKGFQVQSMTKGKFVNLGKPYKDLKSAEEFKRTGQHSMQFEGLGESSFDAYKRDFKSREMDYELRDEKPDAKGKKYIVTIKGKAWKTFDSEAQASRAARTLLNKGTQAAVRTESADMTVNKDLIKESVELEEKSVSVAQQKIMGMALAYKRGEMPDASDEVKKIAKSMTTKELEDFAKTKHKGLPMNKESKTFFALRKELNEAMASSDLYFDTYTAAVQHAKAQAEKKGFEVEEDDWFKKVSVGQGKPKEGKTTSHLLKLTKDGKPVRKGLAIQVYNRGAGKKPYELNFYVS